jgi:glycosyltransferase involved in cell wall biosynthesis
VALYNQASALLFPSHAEGFGWPILEALACGCPVITTNRPPMTEVGGQAVTTIPPAPPPPEALDAWAWEAAQQVKLVLTRNPAEQERFRELGFAQARRFQLELWLDQLESYYQQALALQENRACAA